MYQELDLSPPGGTAGNNTHAGVSVDNYHMMAFQFVVLTAGSTPTVTWKVQGSPDDPQTVSDANAHWYDLGYITDASDTITQTARTATAVGAQIEFISNAVARQYRRYRLVTSLNTNITYYGQAFRIG